MTDKQNFEKDIDVLSNRPDWRITLQADHIKRLEEELQAKEQECERLKLQLAHSCHDVLYKNSLAGQLDKLKQTLEQIKEIAEKIDEECEYLRFGSCALEAKKQILQKISECEANQ